MRQTADLSCLPLPCNAIQCGSYTIKEHITKTYTDDELDTRGNYSEFPNSSN